MYMCNCNSLIFYELKVHLSFKDISPYQQTMGTSEIHAWVWKPNKNSVNLLKGAQNCKLGAKVVVTQMTTSQ
jgi:hypothetical protein